MSIIDELAQSQGLIAEAEDRIAWLKAIGEDDFEDGAVLLFEKVFPGYRTHIFQIHANRHDAEDYAACITPARPEPESDMVYTYAALKAGGKWWLTGVHEAPKAWVALWEFIGEAECWQVVTWERVR